MAHQLPELEYDYAALEPHIDARTMEIHHSKHHAGYVAKLNAALESADPKFQDMPVCKLMGALGELPESIQGAVRNNGGGHANHMMFWQIMSPNGGGEPTGALADAINSTFGSLDGLKEQFSNAAATRFGSGWAWMVVNNGKLEVTSTPNQDNPLMDGNMPICGLDVWEHAYYLNYQNRRPDYIAAFWNVIDWSKVGEWYDRALEMSAS